MIKIKTLLFKLLDEIEPNDLLELKFRSYHSIFVANKKSILPLALEMRYDNVEETSLEQVYRDAFVEDRISEYENDFVMAATRIINNIDGLKKHESKKNRKFPKFLLGVLVGASLSSIIFTIISIFC